MQDLRPEHLTDEEFMRYAYLKGLGKLDEVWVKQLYDRLQRMMDVKDAEPDGEEIYEQGYEAGHEDGYAEGYDAALEKE